MQRQLADRIIFHIDMDSFYASVEVQNNPSLKGLSVVVGADPKQGTGRGVVSTCSYEARHYGVHAGMPISKAFTLLLNKDAVFLPVNMPAYKNVSDTFMNILKNHADKFQQVSIDEAFLDVSDRVNWGTAEDLAIRIKQEILVKTGLTCSIGTAPNKSVAKIASAFKKPDGLTVVKPEDVNEFLSPLPVEKISGIGRKTKERLNDLGVFTIGQLSEADANIIGAELGVIGLRTRFLASGIDSDEVIERGEPKSIGYEDTFDEDTNDWSFIENTIDYIAERIHRRLLKEEYTFKTITLKVRFEDFETHTRSRTLRTFSHSKEEIKEVSKELIDEFLVLDRMIRLIGVRVSNLRHISMQQKKLAEYFT